MIPLLKFLGWIAVMLIINLAHADEMRDIGSPPQFMLPKMGLEADELAVIVNEEDPLSMQIGRYYMAKRGIPESNLIAVRFKAGSATLGSEEFSRIKAQVDALTPPHVQAYALTWVKPYRVECMSITAAFAMGFDKAYCAEGCALTKPSPYFNSSSLQPFQDFKIRPTMTLAALSFEAAQQLIDRGIAADASFPQGSAYLLDTSDKARNVRAASYDELLGYIKGWLKGERIKSDQIHDKQDVLFYFTGLAKVANIETNTFLPGAMADHLTSAGGVLTDGTQMSSLRWLEAGATGSYGTVVEPCNFPAKFPNPVLAVAHYAAGETLIEAYWKSVAMPGQGIFIGEPLSKPFGGYKVREQNGQLALTTYLPSGMYALSGAHSSVGPYHHVAALRLLRGRQELKFKDAGYAYYRIDRHLEKTSRASGGQGVRMPYGSRQAAVQ